MLRKGAAASRGELTERSVVQTPRARLLGGIPNAALGACYYPALALGVWFANAQVAWLALAAAACAAAAVSLILAYSLLFVTRMPCVYCWTSHAVNWMLALLILAQIFNH